MDKKDLVRKGWFKENQVNVCIELTDLCNHRCIMCNQHLNGEKGPHHSERGFMSFELWKKIIDDMKKDKMKVNGISPFWAGEALLHPQFEEMIRYLFDKNKNNELLDTFTLNTNGVLLEKQKADLILELASNSKPGTVNKIIFSLDAATPKIYKRIKQVDNFEKVVSNIDYFLRKQKEMKLNDPKLIMQFIVMKENKHEAKKFLDYWKKKLEEFDLKYQINYDYYPPLVNHTILFTKLNCNNPLWAEKIHRKVVGSLGLVKQDDNKKRLIINDQYVDKNEKRKPCPALWKTPMIRWDGEVTCCCKDLDMKLRMGNVQDNTLKELMNCNEMNKLRMTHIEGDLSEYPYCQKCFNQPQPLMTDEEIEEYLKSVKSVEVKIT